MAAVSFLFAAAAWLAGLGCRVLEMGAAGCDVMILYDDA